MLPVAQDREQFGETVLVPANRHQLGAGPPFMVDVASRSAVRGARADQGFRLVQTPRADGQHHVDSTDHERDG